MFEIEYTLIEIFKIEKTNTLLIDGSINIQIRASMNSVMIMLMKFWITYLEKIKMYLRLMTLTLTFCNMIMIHPLISY